jgi:hypothetical protein
LNSRCVSIVIATHSRCELLPAAIDSVLAQEGCPVELIVVDDGSTDSTPEVLRSYGEALRAVRTNARGRSAARNEGVRLATNEHIGFLDDDDQLRAGAVKALSDRLFESDEATALAYGRPEYRSSEGPVACLLSGLGSEGRVFDRLVSANFIVVGSCLFRKSAFVQLGGFDESMATSEDWHLWLRIAEQYEVAFVDTCVVDVLRHAGNTDQSAFVSAKRAFFQSLDCSAMISRLRAASRSTELRALRRTLVQQALSSQHDADFRSARKLMAVAALCGGGYPLFTAEQLWRSWLPRIGLSQIIRSV